jgi:hypothetical protein
VGRKLHFRRLGVDTRIFLGTEAGTAGKGAGLGGGVGRSGWLLLPLSLSVNGYAAA